MSMMQFYWDLAKKIQGDDKDYSSASSYEDKIDSDYYSYLYSLYNNPDAYNPETNYYYQANKGMSKTGSGSGGSYAPYIAAGGQALGALSSIYNTYQQAEMAEAQLKLLKENNELSYKMFKEGNMFNAEEAEKAFQRSYDASKYTTQSSLMRAAGLNPQLMFGEGNLLHPAQSSAASAEGVPSFQSPVGVQPPQLSFDGFNQLASAMKSIADAKKSGAEVDKIYSLLDEEVKDIQLRNEYQEIINRYQGRLSYEQVVQAIRTNEKIYQEIDNLEKDGKLKEAQTLLTNAQERVAKEMEGKTKAEREFAEEIASRRQEIVQADLEEKNSRTSLNQSTAHYTDVQSDMLPRQVAAQEKSAAAAWLSANASMLSAEAQDYLAKHPNDIEGFLVKAFQGAFGSADKFGAWLAAKLGLSFDDAEDVQYRVKRTGQIPVWFKKRFFEFDPNNLHLQ